jgi:hypothetical protein
MANYSTINNYFFIAPSLTTYSNKHPEYRIMTIDSDTLQVVDYDQYRYYCVYLDWISRNIPRKKMMLNLKNSIASNNLTALMT